LSRLSACVVSGVLSSAAVLVRDSVQLNRQQLSVSRHLLVQRRLRIQRLLEQTGKRDRSVDDVSRQQAMVSGHPRLPLYVHAIANVNINVSMYTAHQQADRT